MSTAAVGVAPYYDSKEGIAEFVKTLKGLNEVQSLRSRADGKRGNLHKFVILGQWWFDTFGQVSTFSGNFIPRIEFPDLPAVMEEQEFYDFIKNHKEPGHEFGGWGMESTIPHVGVVCYECKEPWTIRDCHDMTHIRENLDLPVGNFVGVSLQEFVDFHYTKSDGVYAFGNETYVQNDKWIDLTKDPEYDGLVVNKYGTRIQKKDYILQTGDEVSVTIFRCYHKACNLIQKARNQRKQFHEMLMTAGFTKFKMEAIRNRYTNQDHSDCGCCAPWYKVKFKQGTLIIGWRKRVINTNWIDKGQKDPMGANGSHWKFDEIGPYLQRLHDKLEG